MKKVSLLGLLVVFISPYLAEAHSCEGNYRRTSINTSRSKTKNERTFQGPDGQPTTLSQELYCPRRFEVTLIDVGGLGRALLRTNWGSISKEPALRAIGIRAEGLASLYYPGDNILASTVNAQYSPIGGKVNVAGEMNEFGGFADQYQKISFPAGTYNVHINTSCGLSSMQTNVKITDPANDLDYDCLYSRE